MTRKKRERQLWVDLDFVESLKRIKGNRLAKLGEDVSYGKLTREMARMNKFKEIEHRLSTELISLDEAFLRGLKDIKRRGIRR